MIQDLLEIVLAYFQYLASILQTKGVRFTWSWLETGQGMSFVRLDEAFFTDNIPDLVYDARIFFVIISIILPLLLIFLGLLTFNEPNVVVWYFLLLTSVFTLVSGVCAAVISQTVDLNISFTVAQGLMYGGAAGVLLCSVAYLCRRLNRTEADEWLEGAVNEDALTARRKLKDLEASRKERELRLRERRAELASRSVSRFDVANRATLAITIDDEAQQKDKEDEELKRQAAAVVLLTKKDIFRMQTQHLRLPPFIQGLIFGIVVLAGGIVLVLGSIIVEFNTGPVGPFIFAIGVTLIVIGVLVLAWTLPSLARSGREAKWHISSFLQENGMRLLLLLIMVLYIPIGSSSIIIFNCNQFDCPVWVPTDRSGHLHLL
jgi:hypothetical protein